MKTISQFRKKYGASFTTKHNDKMEGLASLSTSPLCNGICEARAKKTESVCNRCYSMAMHKRFPNLVKTLRKNSDVLCGVEIPKDELPRIFSETNFFRFEAFGDISTETQVVNYFNIARANPAVQCALWTKNPWIIANAMKHREIEKPENLVIIGSSWFVNKPMAEYYQKFPFVDYIFTVYDKKFIAENSVEINCGGRSCAECGKCYTRTQENYEINERLK